MTSMALCSSQLDTALPQLKREDSPERDNEGLSTATASPDTSSSHDKKHSVPSELYALNQGGLPLSVDYRSPVSHFIPPAVELYNAARSRAEPLAADASVTFTPMKRKRGRPRVDKTSPEYLAKSAARKQAKEMAAVMNSSMASNSGEKRKRGRPRIDKTSPDYLARKRAKELEALEKKAKKQYKRRGTGAIMVPKTVVSQSRAHRRAPVAAKAKPLRKLPLGNTARARNGSEKKPTVRRNAQHVKRRNLKRDSAASSSNETAPKVKRKYTKRALSAGGSGPGRPRKTDAQSASGERVKGKRGRPRKADLLAAGINPPPTRGDQQAKIRVRSNLMPINSEPISLDSDDEPDLGSPSQTPESLSLDENLRALRHLHEKYANLERDSANLIQATGRSAEVATRIENLEDSSNSDTDSTSSGSGSGSRSSSSSSSSGSSSSSSSDSESDDEAKNGPDDAAQVQEDTYDGSGSLLVSTSKSTEPQSDSSLSPPLSPRVAPSPPALSESENESPDKSYQCHVCRKWYSTIVTLKIHRRSHMKGASGNSRSRNRSSSRYECDCCNESFSRREKLYEHKAAVHRGSMTVRCSVCRKCFEDDAELALHDQTHTADERACRCSECGGVFSAHSALVRHRQSVHGATGGSAGGQGGSAGGKGALHACPQCGKGFGHAHSLTRHLHNHARQLYKCVVCKASFARADQLAQHLNSHLANYKRLKP